MKAPAYIQKELELINPKYFAVFDRDKKRWRVRKWNSLLRKGDWKIASKEIFTVAKEDELGNNIGYCKIDMRTIKTMKEGFYNARNAVRLLRSIDKDNARLEENANKETDYQMRNGAKRIWHHYQEPTVYMNQGYGR